MIKILKEEIRMLKKMSALCLSLLLAFSVLSVSPAYAASKGSEGTPTSGVRSADPNHAVGQYNTVNGGGMSPNATGLIATIGLDLYRGNGNTLILDGTTNGTQVLDKIGFQDITLQRWQNGQWTNVKVWSTYKNDSSSYSYEYSTTVTPGYDYRFVATHYGELDWLFIPSIETHYNETSYLHVG
jgi:hypothetical protein